MAVPHEGKVPFIPHTDFVVYAGCLRERYAEWKSEPII